MLEALHALLCWLGWHTTYTIRETWEDEAGRVMVTEECLWCGREGRKRKAKPVEAALHTWSRPAPARPLDTVRKRHRICHEPEPPLQTDSAPPVAQRTVADMRGAALPDETRREVQHLRAAGMASAEIAETTMEQMHGRTEALEPRRDRYWPSIHGTEGKA